MEQQNYLIDTNVVIDYLGNKLTYKGMQFMNAVIDAVPNISVITKIEVLGFNISEEQYQILTDFMDDAIVFELTEEVADLCIGLRKKYKSKLPDAIIAATALAASATLITRNLSDFKNINGLYLIDPYSL
ncbi:MAG: type II toxin-antitoxin system VapC family toxin [Paludibacter sp.]